MRWTSLLSMVVAAGAWVALFRPVLAWTAGTLALEENRASLVVVLGVAVVAIARAIAARGGVWPELRAGPVALVVAGVAGFVAVERAWDVDLASAACCALATYGAVGLFVPAARWRAALPVALLLVVALPIGPHLDAIVGFPARVVTARIAAAAAQLAGAPSTGVETVLVFENGVASVDLPCSGVKSLWVGAIVFLALTVIERRRAGLAWLGAGAAYAVAILAANAVRVVVLVVVGLAFGSERAAAILHVPLGVAGFTAATAGAWWAIRWLREVPVEEGEGRAPGGVRVAGLAVVFAIGALAWAPRAIAGAPIAVALDVPARWAITEMPASEAENDLFRRHGGTLRKVAFEAATGHGWLLLVHARSWRAQHAPEQCLASGGARLSNVHLVQRGEVEARELDLDGGRAVALTWLQSARRTTASLLDRTWASWTGGERDWVLVTLVVDRPAEGALDALAADVKAAVAAALEKLE